MTTTLRTSQYEGPKACVYRVRCPHCQRPTLIGFGAAEAIIRHSCTHFRAVVVVGGHDVRVEFCVEPIG